MTAGKYDFLIEQGSVIDKTFYYKDENNNAIDLTGYTAKMMLKEEYTDTTPLLILQTSDSTIVIDGALGKITLDVDASTTAALDFETAYYDLELYPAGVENDAFKVVYGTITLRKEVTK